VLRLLDLHSRPSGKTAVLDENFDNEDTVFGPRGTFLREVSFFIWMDLGKLFQSILLLFFPVFQTIYSHVT
jgi:hypothetical protein